MINNKVIINNSESFNKVLLKKRKKKLYDDWIYFSSKDKTQYIALQANFGGGEDQYKRFKIAYIEDPYQSFVPPEVKEYLEINGLVNHFMFLNSDLEYFTSESGIRLGISQKELKQILRNRSLMKYTEKNKVIYTYNNDDCLYTAEYIFEHDKLVSFSFGYETP